MFVKQAAIKFRGITWTLPRPARHHHILHAMKQALADAGNPVVGVPPPIQGFLSNTGVFLTREEAADLVRRGSRWQLRGRLRAAVGAGDPAWENQLVGDKLYSEDLW